VRLELQVQRRCCGDYLRVRLRVRGLLYISFLPFLASPCVAATVGSTGWAFGGTLQEWDCVAAYWLAWLQGASGAAAAMFHCKSSNGTLLQLVCASPTPATATPRASTSCDLPVPPAGGVVLTLVAMEDFDNGGPAVKAACLVCTGPPGLGSRAAAVGVEITNVVRPIVGDADFAEGGNKSEPRSVLRGGALSISSPHGNPHGRHTIECRPRYP
jgi:hypothetical protein